MSHAQHQVLVTGASGQLGQLVVDQLLAMVPAGQVAATVRTREAAAALAARGVQARIADYDQPDSLDDALTGIGRVLLISSSDLGRRVAQHRNVIEAAQRAGVGLLAYTSVLHADTSPLGLAGEHRDTEALLQNSGVPFVLLRRRTGRLRGPGRLCRRRRGGADGSTGHGRADVRTRRRRGI